MSDQKTTISVGFKTDTQGLTDASRKINDLKRSLERMRGALPGGVRVTGGDESVAGSRRPNLWNQVRRSVPGRMGASVAGTGIRAGMGGLAALGMVTGAVGVAIRAVSSAKQYLAVLDPLAKQLSIVGHGQDKFISGLERTGVAIGKNQIEMLHLTKAYAAFVGQQGGGVGRQIRTIGLLSKGMGLDPNAMGSAMGSMGQIGAFGQYGKMRVERFAAVLADAVSKGRMKGREQELFSAIQSLMGAQLNILTRLAPGSSTAMIGALTAMNASGRPGLMGSRGASVLGRIDQGFRNPQGDFGEYYEYKALGGGDYFDYQMKKEKGIFGDRNLSKIMGALKKDIKDPKARWYTIGQMFGISMHQAQAFEGLNLQGDSGFMDSLEKATNGNLEGISADKLGIMAQLYNSSGDKRKALFGDSRIEGIAKKGGWTASTDIGKILKDVATGDMAATKQEALVSGLTAIDNDITDLGKKIIPGMTKVVEGVESLVKFFTAPTDVKPGKIRKQGHRGRLLTPKADEVVAADEAAAAAKAVQKAKDQSNLPVSGQIAASIGDILFSDSRLSKPAEVTVKLKVDDQRLAGDGSSVKVQK